MPDSETDILTHFAALDELIQLIYQGSHKFVVLSSVDDVSWTIHLGLNGDDGRWWRGRWTERDIRGFVGNSSSAILLEAFADRLAASIVQGELLVGGWSSQPGAPIDLTLGPTAKTPIRIPLVEVDASDAASFATKIFSEVATTLSQKWSRWKTYILFQIALQAQSRKSRLHPPAFAAPPSFAAPQLRTASSSKRTAETAPLARDPSVAEVQAQEKIKELEAELEVAKRRKPASQSKPDGLASKAKGTTPVRPLKGASLANPNKKARKYQALEFESDED
ncbi:hypothetical protein NLI96_g1066 [Meripilus lineatus]|uniref:Uncharacterized protein n=1 Tax=Meripilus lineatus TaxID=2056292 RepID=A0AAD5YIS1_9APHY|nr:hypothetical protein NLI96_g1066 [Physisporinus lineatus]